MKKQSLTQKTIRLTVVNSIILAVVALFIGLSIYGSSLIDTYVSRAFRTAENARHSAVKAADSVSLSGEVMGIYKSLTPEQRALMGTDEYNAFYSGIDTVLQGGGTYDVLYHMLSGYVIDVDYVYLAMYDRDTCALVYITDPDPNEKTRMEIGEWEAVSERECNTFLDWDGEGRLYIIRNEPGYGWMCTAGYPIWDSGGEICEFLLVDVSVGSVISGLLSYAFRVSLGLIAATVLISWIVSRHLKRAVVAPINAIAGAAGAYVEDKKNGVDSRHFAALDVKTGDELENLAHVMADMEEDLSAHEDHIRRITAEKERINTELTMATQIQEGMLPSAFPPYPDRKEFDVYASMHPAREVGGDFYDFFLIDPDHLGMVIADVSGKGVPAALFMMISKTILQNCAMLGNKASGILEKTNEALCSENKMDMFVTAWVGILEISTGRMTCSNAGHEYPVVYSAREGRFSLIKDKHGIALGAIEGSRYKEYELRLEKGDKLFVYTDGVPEATNIDEELFGMQRLVDELNRDVSRSPRAILYDVRKTVDAFVGEAEQFDDMTMLCLDYKGI